MLSDLPPELLNEVISYLAYADRRKLRATSKIMKSAMMNSDLRVNDVIIEKMLNNTIKVKIGKFLIINVDPSFVGETNLILYLKIRQLVKRIFASRVVLSADTLDERTLDVISRLKDVILRICTTAVLEEPSMRSRVLQFLGGFNGANISVFINNTIIDPKQLLSITTPLQIYAFVHAEWITYGEIMDELEKQGHTIEQHNSTTILKLLEIIALLENAHSVSYLFSVDILDDLLNTMGISRTDAVYVQKSIVEGMKIRNVSRRTLECAIVYKGGRINIYTCYEHEYLVNMRNDDLFTGVREE